MREHILGRRYHVEIIPPKHDSTKPLADLALFGEKYRRVMGSGFCACITDNAMGLLAFQGHETIEYLDLPVPPEQVMLHINTFHSKQALDELLSDAMDMGVKYLLIVSGDGCERLPRLSPADLGTQGESVTSVELLAYIRKNYPSFSLGAAFNPYEPPEHEFAKLDAKLAAGAAFVITQPILGRNEIVDRLLREYPDLPVIVEAWMSKKLFLLSDVVGYTIPEDTAFDPIAALEELHRAYPDCGFYLSILGFKTQYHLVEGLWERVAQSMKGGARA